MRLGASFAALAILCLGAVAVGVRAAAPQEQPPTFRSRVQLIEVEVRVTDRHGDPVRGLAKEDFTLVDDDVTQTISTASFVDMTVESPVRRRLPADVEPDVATNAGTGRMWVMLLSGFGERARHVARQFVNESLGPNDHVAVIHVNGTMSAAQGFTRNRLLMINAIDRLQVAPPDDLPEASRGPIDGSGRSPFMVLEDVCRRLALINGRRKSVIFFDPPAIWIPDMRQLGEVGAFFEQRDAIRCASRNNIAVYVVDTNGMSTTLGNLTTLAAKRAIAEDTGGDAIVNSNNFEGGYARFIRESNAYYLLGYVPTVEHRDGRFHDVKVKVNRPDVTVRARRGYYAPVNVPGGRIITPPLPDTPRLSADARDALAMPLPVSGVTIDLSTAPFRGRDGNASVLLTARVRGQELSLAAGEQLEVGYQATTTEGKTTPGAFHVFKLDLLEGSRASAVSAGLRLVDWLSLPRGRHQVRFVVSQPKGHTGMVVGDVDVPDFTNAAISMSGLVLASDRSVGQPTMKTDESLEKMLRALPTAERTFRRTDVLTAYGEVYTNAKTRLDGVIATIARTTQLRQPTTLASSVVVSEPGRSGTVARVALKDFQAGDYVLTLEARGGKQTVSRKVPFTVIN